MEDKRNKTDLRTPAPREKVPEKKPRDGEGQSARGDGIRPKDADADYGPPDPDDPQRSGT
jgi:hypothetical protein